MEGQGGNREGLLSVLNFNFNPKHLLKPQFHDITTSVKYPKLDDENGATALLYTYVQRRGTMRSLAHFSKR